MRIIGIHLLLFFSIKLMLAQPVEQTSFEGLADESVFNQASWVGQGFSVPWVNGFDQNRAHIDDAYAHSGTKSLRMYYPANQFGPSNTGGQAPLMVPPANQYYISYWMRFSDNFSWGTTSEGGKLPGLAGGGRCSGCATCVGTNGFTARLMWRTGGRIVLYLYHMDKAGACGDDITLQYGGVDFYAAKGQWYNVIERVKINTGNNFDGEVELWINQQQALQVTGIRFVNNGDQVDNLYFSTFHGGSTADWAPVVDSYMWFDDIVISTNAADVLTPLSIGFFNANQQKDNTINLSSHIKIQPQPVEGGAILSIDASSLESKMESVELITQNGKVLQKVIINDNECDWVIPSVDSGMYILKINYIDKTLYKKVAIH